MNTTVDRAVKLIKNMIGHLEDISGIITVICPPYVSLRSVREIVEGHSVELDAQNMHSEEQGAYTGEISPLMLIDLCRYIAQGHSQ